MSKIYWETNLVERAFCEQLQKMGWEWTEGDVDVAELTERENFREVFLKNRLVEALRQVNLRDGQPWLDDARVEKAIRDLKQAPGHQLLEINQAATELLLKGTVAEGLPDWDNNRPQPIRYIDFETPEKNDFLVVNQFKVELTSGRGHVIPDAVLFVNGIPVVVAEFKSPGIENPIHEAINQILRYSNQRRELFPTLYTDSEGVEKLFYTNQLLIASDFFEARAATVGAPPEAYLEWSDTSPIPISAVTEDLGIGSTNGDLEEAKGELLSVGPEQTERVGTPLFFRRTEQRPEALGIGQGAALQSQQVLTAGMLRPAHLLDLIRNFTIFQQVDGKTRKIVAHYQQFRAIQKATLRLQEGRTRSQGAERDERGGIIWHTQGSGKSLSMVFLVRKMRTLDRLKRYKIVTVTDRTDLEGQLRETARLSGEAVRPTDKDRSTRESSTAMTQRILSESTPDIVFAMLQKYQDVDRQAKSDEKIAMTIVRKEKKPGKDEPVVEKEVTFEESIHFEEFPVLNESDEILVLVDEAHRSHSRSLHRNLRKALPNAAIIGFTGTPILSKDKTETRAIFGDFIDKYLLQDAEMDGTTVPILYEGRTADGLVKDASNLDQLFEDMFRTYSEGELAVIKAKYCTAGDVLEAPLLIEQKAADMLRHYVSVVLPEGYKAQVVATSRRAAISYREKLLVARDKLVRNIEALPASILTLQDHEIQQLDQQTRFLVRAHVLLPRIRALDVAVVISGNHNDPEPWWDWSNKEKQDEYTKRFKRKLAVERTEKTDPLALMVVNNMLLTGFDAPIEQVIYLDRKVIAHDLLQAIARVNRTHGHKKCGYVVDYIGVARHLNDALKDYDREDTSGALIDINVELPKLIDRRNRAVAVFIDRGITDLQTEVEVCVALLEDLKVRAGFINKLRMFYETLNILEHRPEVPSGVFRDAKLLGFINKVAANLYRDSALNLQGVAEKVKALIDSYILARGVDPKIPPTTITDTEFERVLQAQSGSRARAAQMQYAARYHIIGFTNQNPAFARKMSEKLEEILKRFKDDWDALERELRKFIDELRQGDRNDFPGLDPYIQVPFVRLILEACSEGRDLDDAQKKAAINTTLDIVERIRQEVVKVGFWKNSDRRELLTKQIVRDLDASGVCPLGKERDIAQRLVALAKENHENLVRK
ncbi:type I site-specific deoxyribonuclease, HsdR family [Dehalogenimonas alkenigignens]|uniref:Type I restriction enzyme endonuclease subunit n=1 Tax=Dehalogenimonas alkenigignens TaxID=1217799 RepID=A0A0W0GKS5_9CHLR|nr:HsdR family type I site-specific deoxyribonuclease [Dehalogenimonas alkenigignens]KTB49139.1 type I site-specific deoxyribonuclease, HsdR family [Dehalogenimonas alkenigignens]